MDLQKLSSNLDSYHSTLEKNGWSGSVNRESSLLHKKRINEINKCISQDTYVPSSKKEDLAPMTEQVKEALARYLELISANTEPITLSELSKELYQSEIKEKGVQGTIKDILDKANVQQDELDKKGLIGVLQDIQISKTDVDKSKE